MIQRAQSRVTLLPLHLASCLTLCRVNGIISEGKRVFKVEQEMHQTREEPMGSQMPSTAMLSFGDPDQAFSKQVDTASRKNALRRRVRSDLDCLSLGCVL